MKETKYYCSTCRKEVSSDYPYLSDLKIIVRHNDTTEGNWMIGEELASISDSCVECRQTFVHNIKNAISAAPARRAHETGRFEINPRGNSG